MTVEIDLHCDMGESFGIYTIGDDEGMMRYVTSVSVGCGFHAGDPHIMRKTVDLAKQYGVAVGAHPGYPDLIGFGRRKITKPRSGDRCLSPLTGLCFLVGR